MDERYIRCEALAIDQAARDRVRDYINAYAASSRGHPFAGYGDHINLKTYELCPIYVVSLRTQYDQRYVNTGQYPYKNTDIPARRFLKESDVDAWSYELRTTDRFTDDQCAYEVPGSQHVEICSTCAGKGKVTCPTCDGEGRVTCSDCGGSGALTCTACGGRGSSNCSSCNGRGYKQESYEERYVQSMKFKDGFSTPVYGYRTAYRDVVCPSCRGSGKHICSSCDGRGEHTCSKCGGKGDLLCTTCDGRGKVTCKTCQGYGRNVHAFYVFQRLYNICDTSYFHDPRVREVAEIYDQKGNYKWTRVFDFTAEALGRGVFSEEREMAARMDSFIAKHAGEASRDRHILFQRADILRVDAWWVEYTYKGKHYNGVISGDYFYAGVSPISEYSDNILKKADKSLGGVGTVKARKLVEQAEGLGVYDNRDRVRTLRELVKKHLNTLSKLGTDLMFWLIALFVTPFLYNFYDSLNPVLRYAYFTNDPLWTPYNWLPAIQCLIFLVLLWVAKVVLNGVDHSKDRHVSVFGFVLTGMGLYLLVAVGILAVLLGLNYLGVSIVTTWVGYAVWRVIRFFLFVAVVIIGLLIELVKWLWHLIF